MKTQLQRHIINISSPAGAAQHGWRTLRASRHAHAAAVYAEVGGDDFRKGHCGMIIRHLIK